MTLKDHDPSYHARWRIRTRFTRFHCGLSAMLFANQLDAAYKGRCRPAHPVICK